MVPAGMQGESPNMLTEFMEIRSWENCGTASQLKFCTLILNLVKNPNPSTYYYNTVSYIGLCPYTIFKNDQFI